MYRHFLTIAMVAVGMTTLSACDMAFESTSEDDAALTGKISAVRLNDIGSGSVTVRGNAAKPALHRKLRYRGDRPSRATHRVDAGVLVLDGCGSRCSVSYTIDLPPGVDVSGSTSSGSIELSQVGVVNVKTSSGSIRLSGVSGQVKAQTSNGRIQGEGLKGSGIDARTSNGAIVLTPSKPQSVRAQTSNGDIALTLPAGPYRVSTRSNNGDKKVTVPNEPSAALHLDLTTSNGDITAKPA